MQLPLVKLTWAAKGVKRIILLDIATAPAWSWVSWAEIGLHPINLNNSFLFNRIKSQLLLGSLFADPKL